MTKRHDHPSDEARRKMSEGQKRRWRNMTPEKREAFRALMRRVARGWRVRRGRV